MKYLEVQERSDWPMSPPYPVGAWLFNGTLHIVDAAGQWYTTITNASALVKGSVGGGDGVDVHRLFDQLIELKK
jgi:hypothetical protein